MAIESNFNIIQSGPRDEITRAYHAIVPALCFIFNAPANKRGTGFVVALDDDDESVGYVATASHVVEIDDDRLSSEVNCVFNLGGSYFECQAELLFAHHEYDIALLKVIKRGVSFPSIKLFSGVAPVGFEIATVGFAWGESTEIPEGIKLESFPSVSKGIISGIIPRQMTGGILIYQIDAVVLKGVSGGPVFGFALGEPEVFGIVIESVRLPDSPIPLTLAVSVGYIIEELRRGGAKSL